MNNKQVKSKIKIKMLHKPSITSHTHKIMNKFMMKKERPPKGGGKNSNILKIKLEKLIMNFLKET